MIDPDETPEQQLEAIGRIYMPFGLFGPKHYPPKGVPLFDLPMEYLAWWTLRGYPKGRLGHYMRIVYETKAAEGDALFDHLRRRNGGRFKFRPAPQRHYHFDSPEDDA